MIAELAGRPNLYVNGKQFTYGNGDDSAVVGQIFYSGGGWGDPNNVMLCQGNADGQISNGQSVFAFNVTNYYSQGGGIGYSFHTGICQVLMGDGTVRGLNQNMSVYVAASLVTRDGGEVVGAF